MALIGCVAVLVLATFAGTSNQVAAQQATKSAEDVLNAGLAAQKAGKHTIAVQYFSRAINAGLVRRRMTFALYRRAISNRAGKRPAQAISDLNSALYFKGDLSPRDRADAIEERAKAFRDAGLTPTSVATSSKETTTKPWSASAAPAQPVQPRVVTTAPPRVKEVSARAVEPPRPSYASLPQTTPILGPAKDTLPRAGASVVEPPRQFETRVVAQPVPAARPARSYLAPKVERGVGVSKETLVVERKPVAAVSPWKMSMRSAPAVTPNRIAPAHPARPPTEEPAKTAASLALAIAGSKTAGPAPRPVPPRPLATASAEPPRAPTTSNGGSVAQFFSNLLGGRSSSASSSPIVTGSVDQVSKVASPVQPAAQATPVKVAVARPPSTPAPRTSTAPERFEIQVAVLRSRARAEALAQQLMVQYPGSFWSGKKRSRVVEAAVRPGSEEEGARYAVNYGLYENRRDTAAMCEQFKAGGLDCEIVPPN